MFPMSDLKRRRTQVIMACKELGMTDEDRHDFQELHTGKTSLTVMTLPDVNKLIAELKNKGWNPRRPGRRPAENSADKRFIWVLWRLLGDAGAVKPGRAALRAFISNRNYHDKWGKPVTDVSFLSQERAADVIEALKDICRRNGVKLDRPS